MSNEDQLRVRLRAHVVEAGIDAQPLASRIRERISEEGERRNRWPRAALAGALAAVLLAAASVGSLVSIRTLQRGSGFSGTATSSPAPVAPAVPFPRLVQEISQDPGGLWLVGSQMGDTGSSGFGFYTSRDGGRTWNLVLPLGAGSLLFAKLFDGQEGVVMWAAQGMPPIIDTTHDGGRHWTKTEARLLNTLDSCQFADPTDGWCIQSSSASSTVWAIKDGGASWLKVSSLPHFPVPTSPSFFSSDEGWIGTVVAGPDQSLLLYKSIDGGRSWGPVQLAPPSKGYPGFSAYLGPVSNLDTGLLATVLTVDEGSMGVGSPMALYSYTSADDSRTWSGPHPLWSGLAAQSGRPWVLHLTPNRWVVATARTALISSDGGTTWSSVQLPLPPGYAVTAAAVQTEAAYAVAQPTSCVDVACSLLLASRDGGVTWSVIASSPTSMEPNRPPDNKGRGR